MSPQERRDGGFTLVELLISLLLFALIAVAGIALVDSVLGVGTRTEERLDRLAAVQRAMLVIGGDIAQVAGGDVVGGGAVLAFRRSAPGVGGAPADVRYALAGDTLVRELGGRRQTVLRGVGALTVRFFDGGWLDAWPAVPGARAWPRAVEVVVTLAGPGDGPGTGPGAATMRRVVLLPVRAADVT